MARSTFLQAVIQELTEAKSKGSSVEDQNTKGNNTTDTTYCIDNTGPAPKISTTLHKGKVGKKIAKETIKKIFDNLQTALANKMALYEMVGNVDGMHKTRQQLMEFHGMRRSMEDGDRVSNMRFQIPDELKGRVRDNGESRNDYDDREYEDYEESDDYDDLSVDDYAEPEQQFTKGDVRDSNDLDKDGIEDDQETEDHDDTQIVQGHSDQELSVDSSVDDGTDAPEEDIDVGSVINNVLEKLRNDHTLTVRDAFLSVLNADGNTDSNVTMNFGDDLPQPEQSDIEQMDSEDSYQEDSLTDDEPQMDSEYNGSEDGDFNGDDGDFDEDDLDYRDDSYRPRTNQDSRFGNSEDEYQDDQGFDDDDYEDHDANFPPTKRRMYETSMGSRSYAIGYKNGSVTSREQTVFVKADSANQAVGKIAKVLKEHGIMAHNLNVRDAYKSEISELLETEDQNSSFDCNGCSVQKLRDVNHAQMICKGTSWNICNDSTFNRASDEGPLYVVIKQGKPMFLLQPATQKFVDARNKDIDSGLAQKLLNLR